jgi:trans-aconitate 2-methyltransferase
MPREWDAASYNRLSDPQLAMARDVIDRLDLRGDERVLDAGCGSGRVTEILLDRVPNGEVVAVDGSEAMVAQARERLGARADVSGPDRVEQ